MTMLRTVCGIPSVNPTRPTEPQNFTLRTIAGAIVADWDPPTVVPLATEYQLIATPNSADASVGTVAWQGNADQVTLPWAWMPNSPWWWHVRAVQTSYASAYAPNTYGLLGIVSPAPNQLAWPIPDPQFQAGPAVGSYWSFSGGSTGATLSGSGGLTPTSGKLTVVGSSGSFARMYPSRATIPGPPALFTTFPVGAGRTLIASVTFRRRSTLAGSGGQAGFELLLDVGADGVGYGPAINSADTYIRCDTVALDTWVTRVASAYVSVNSGCDAAEASLRFNAGLCSSGTIEVGRFDVALS